MAELDPVLEIEAVAVAGLIEELDYFQILKIESNAAPSAIKAAYYRESRIYHPDQFFSVPDGDAKRAIEKIYRRINEAYVCLRDDAKRTKYVADIGGPERAKKLRFTEQSEQEQKQAREEELGKTPQGKKMFAAAMLDLDGGRVPQALQSLKMAVMYEPANAYFKQKLEEVQKLAKK